MFLDTSGFKKLIKEAWKCSRLFLSRKDGSLLITDLRWCLVSDTDMIPNKIKGAIIELTGELPEEGESFQSGKEGNQYSFTQTLPWEEMRALNDKANADIRAEQTEVLIELGDKILRILKYKTTSFFIQKWFTDLITCEELIKGKETPPQGPYVISGDDEVNGVWWTNWTGVFLICGFSAGTGWCKGLLNYCASQEVGIKK